MNKISDIRVLSGYRILVNFETGEDRICDITPFLSKGDFKELKDPSIFNTVKSITWGIEWSNGLDLSADTLEAIGVPVSSGSIVADNG